jgi:glycosyltransferase involved in cell wall biosynthesis
MERIVIVCETFSRDMGYLTAVLPKYLARRGFDVHVVSLDLAAYHSDAEWRGKMPEFLTKQVAPPGSSYQHNGYTVHILAHGRVGRYPYARGLVGKLRELNPRVVYSAVAIGALPIQCAIGKLLLGYQLYTGNHSSSMAFPLAKHPHPYRTLAGMRSLITRGVHGRLVSYLTRKCYARTEECGMIARRFFGVQPRKVVVVPLGVDTDYFFPVTTPEHEAERARLRASLGVAPEEILCVFSGRLIASKRIFLLVRALDKLRSEGLPFRGLFVAEGPERAEIENSPWCKIIDLVPFKELGTYYRAADISVWPGTESTSVYDAAACGIPTVCNERIAKAHLLDNGFAHEHDNLDSLLDCLRRLADPALRKKLGEAGARRARVELGWENAAAVRERDFRELQGRAG